MFRRSAIYTSLLLTTGLLTAGCESMGPGSGRGLTLLLTDAPGDYHAAVVTISQVYLQGQGGRTVLVDEPVTYDLLELRNEIATLVQGLDVPEGSYHELRLVVDGAYIEVEQADGSTKIYASSEDYAGLAGAEVAGHLQMPSMSESGLKIKLPGGKLDVGEGETIVLIDFDVAESFGHQAGNSGKWVMHPVIKATDVTFGGNVLAQMELADTVTLPQLNGQAITLDTVTARLTPADGGADRDIALSDADGDGVFETMFKGIAPGEYNLTFVLPEKLSLTLDPVPPVPVTVVARQTSTQSFEVTNASALP